MSLYDIDSKIREIIERGFIVDEETGEVIDSTKEINAKLEELEFDRTSKIENIALYLKNLEALTSSLKREEEALAKRRKVKENRIESLKAYLTQSMTAAGENGIETSKVCISLLKRENVITDADKLPKKWLTKTVTFKPDKMAIKKAIKDGLKVKGASIEVKTHIQIK